MLRKEKSYILIFVLAISVASCGPTPTPALSTPTTVPAVAATLSPVSVSPLLPSVVVTDSAKRTVTITGVPQRIVSLAPSATEIAFALGLGNRIVAVDTYSDYPQETKDLPKLKTFPVNYEQLVSYKPDLVLAAGVTRADEIKKMEELKLTVLVAGASTSRFEDVFGDILLVGRATGTETQAKRLNDSMRQKVEDIRARLATANMRPRVYWELDATDPTKPFTPGPGSFINDIIALAGGINVAANAKSTWAQLNAEEIIAANPDVIILSDLPYGITVESVKARKGWDMLNAVKQNQILPIQDSLVSRAGPRVADGLEAAARLIHPELFK